MIIPHSKPSISEEEIAAVHSVLESGFIAEGRLVREFENKFRKYIGVRYALSTNSGTSALHLALLALKIKPEDEVIIPSYVCTAVLNAVNYVGAVARIADINRDDFNISAASAKQKISRRTRAIIVPHMFGMPADMDALKALGLPIIEDCALSVGAAYKDRKVGSFGLVSIFSFYATKVLTCAEGGMLLTNAKLICAAVSDLKDYDNRERYRVRYNYKMSDFAAALGLTQLKRLDEFVSRRQKIAAQYNKGLADLGVRLPLSTVDKIHIYFRYIICYQNKADMLINALKRLGIEAKKPIYKPLHIYLNLSNKAYPAATDIYKSAVSLPIYPGLKDGQVKSIIAKVKKALRGA
jgi:perosamine synthetase